MKLKKLSQDWVERTGKTLPGVESVQFGTKKKAHHFLEKSKYRSLFNILLKSTAAKDAMTTTTKVAIRKEMAYLQKKKNLYPRNPKKAKFDWTTFLHKIQVAAPTLYSVVEAAMTKTKQRYEHTNNLIICHLIEKEKQIMTLY